LLKGSDFTRALEHARRQFELYKKLSEINPTCKGQLKSVKISLASISFVRESKYEGIIIERINSQDLFESVRVEDMPEMINDRRSTDRREADRRIK